MCSATSSAISTGLRWVALTTRRPSWSYDGPMPLTAPSLPAPAEPGRSPPGPPPPAASRRPPYSVPPLRATGAGHAAPPGAEVDAAHELVLLPLHVADRRGVPGRPLLLRTERVPLPVGGEAQLQRRVAFVGQLEQRAGGSGDGHRARSRQAAGQWLAGWTRSTMASTWDRRYARRPAATGSWMTQETESPDIPGGRTQPSGSWRWAARRVCCAPREPAAAAMTGRSANRGALSCWSWRWAR